MRQRTTTRKLCKLIGLMALEIIGFYLLMTHRKQSNRGVEALDIGFAFPILLFCLRIEEGEKNINFNK